MNKLKLLLSLLMATLILFAGQRLYFLKNHVMDEAYSDIIFTRLAVETQTFTRQIEYGLKNGKSLENFYNVQGILNEVKRCYSYIDGAYIVSADYRLLYSNAEQGEYELTRIDGTQKFEGDMLYTVYDEMNHDRYIISVPIYGRNDVLCGYMVLNVSYLAVENIITESMQENLVQTIVCGILAYLVGVILMIHCCKKESELFKSAGFIFAGTACGAIFVDGAISIYRLMAKSDSIIQQSVSKIVMSLQYDLDTIGEKGVAFNKIYDLNTWLHESCNKVPFIEKIIYDKNYKISAVVSEEYVIDQTLSYAGYMGLALLICALSGAALIMLFIGFDHLRDYIKRRNKKMTQQNVRILQKLEEDRMQNALLIRALNITPDTESHIYGESVAVLDGVGKIWLFSLKDDGDFEKLLGMLKTPLSYTFMITDEAYLKDVSSAISVSESVDYLQYTIDVPVFSDTVHEWPEGVEIVKIDESWTDYILSLYKSPEFGNEAYIRKCLRVNPAYGALLNGERAGFIMEHANGELGTIYVVKEARRYGIGRLLMQAITPDYVNQGGIGVGLVLPSNAKCTGMLDDTNYKLAPKKIMWIYK